MYHFNYQYPQLWTDDKHIKILITTNFRDNNKKKTPKDLFNLLLVAATFR